jgi:hypothetical protein
MALTTSNAPVVTLEQYIAASKSSSQPCFNRPDIQPSTSIRTGDYLESTPNNTSQAATSFSASILTTDDMTRSSLSSMVADLSLGAAEMEVDLPNENKSFNILEIEEMQA